MTACRVRTRAMREDCQNPPLDEFGVCWHHLRDISGYWSALLREAIDEVATTNHPSNTPINELCRRCGRTGHDRRKCDA